MCASLHSEFEVYPDFIAWQCRFIDLASRITYDAPVSYGGNNPGKPGRDVVALFVTAVYAGSALLQQRNW